MSVNVGNTIQKIINNTPIEVTVNNTTTSVVTNGGNVFQAGLVNNKIQNSFQQIFANENVVGKVVDAESSENSLYLLNDSGSVFEYLYNSGTCSPLIREIYAPTVCDGDKAVKIDSGRDHVVILTEGHRVFGAGDNSQYQLVPQGQCRYDIATELLITDVNAHDNKSCRKFTGILRELEKPKIPSNKKPCDQVNCVKDSIRGAALGQLILNNVTIQRCPPNGSPMTGSLHLTVCGDFEYVAFLCVDCYGKVSGNLTFKITKLYLKECCQTALFVVENPTAVIEEVSISTSNNQPFILFDSEIPIPDGAMPITGTVPVDGRCGDDFLIKVPHLGQDHLVIANLQVSFDVNCGIIIECENTGQTASVKATKGAIIGETSVSIYRLVLDNLHALLDCCPEPPSCKVPDPELPQPCWIDIAAGYDLTVLVDECYRLYVLGSLYEVRNNKELLKRSCLDDLLSKTSASITLPADQLNCCVRPRNETCDCVRCRDKCFKTDLSKFGIHLNFPNDDDCCDNEWEKRDCDKKVHNVCDFLKALQQCNERPLCDNTCEPCDTNIYLDVGTAYGCKCDGDTNEEVSWEPLIKSITLHNKKSICKIVSQRKPDVVEVWVNVNSTIEFDLNRYCVDGVDIPLMKTVVLRFGCPGQKKSDGYNVNLYVDIDSPGGILFVGGDTKITGRRDKCSVEFTVDASECDRQFILNYGSILDPVELANLKQALYLDAAFPCPRFKNPFDTKLFNTYLKGGDRVCFTTKHCDMIKQAVTADVPTLFKLNRRILDIGVGDNNLSVLLGGLACPNEVCVIGNNCFGELGINSNESIVCWEQVNRCLFDCQVYKIFSGKAVTFYITQSQRVFASGQWKCLVDSNIPVCIPSICQDWRIKDIAISDTHIAMVGKEGCVFGVGDNSLGELGLCHCNCIPKPVQIPFFYNLNQCYVKDLYYGTCHPIERAYYKKDGCCGGPDYGYDDCNYKCEVRYFRAPRSCIPGKKYIPNARLCQIPFQKYNKN